MKKLHMILVGALACLSVGAAAETLEDRIKPAGSLCMAGNECATAPSLQVAAVRGSRSGQHVYEYKCATCHATGAAGAPKLGDAAAWAPRIGKGIDTLYTHAIAGFNAMPAKGLCFDCSDDEIKASVDYLVDHSK